MKYLVFIFIFSLFSCKSDDKKLEGFQEKAVEMNQENSAVSIDTTSFMEFFESFIFDKRLQKSNKDYSIDYNFFSSKDFIAYLNSDTLSVFEDKNLSDEQGLIILDFKKGKNLKYKFEKINNKWTFSGSNAISINSLSEKKFVDFLMKFSKDSIYQKSHILFPLVDYSLDDDYEIISQKIEKGKWNHFNLVEEIESLLFLANIDSNNNFRNIYYRGNDNGILIKLTFKKVNNNWFLVKTEDYST
ncbi:DUF4348 domain-containing protein [Flavobacterium sp. HXWNR69]|jgi:hypothetical protein|uniref:DUF4348 domain-containing protein n=1 Tax=Flavobacterium fragile TaxID=2949085 RepID=A0ABT0THU3_9FLAO|nr:DUF4348 domain-containing protein [Flavobacterium sp. HXWNR69]MCL9770417.1 DUF4348 domain-containing protein [Flavobacterium sp. HXWNR69]